MKIGARTNARVDVTTDSSSATDDTRPTVPVHWSAPAYCPDNRPLLLSNHSVANHHAPPVNGPTHRASGLAADNNERQSAGGGTRLPPAHLHPPRSTHHQKQCPLVGTDSTRTRANEAGAAAQTCTTVLHLNATDVHYSTLPERHRRALQYSTRTPQTCTTVLYQNTGDCQFFDWTVNYETVPVCATGIYLKLN